MLLCIMLVIIYHLILERVLEIFSLFPFINFLISGYLAFGLLAIILNKYFIGET